MLDESTNRCAASWSTAIHTCVVRLSADPTRGLPIATAAAGLASSVVARALEVDKAIAIAAGAPTAYTPASAATLAAARLLRMVGQVGNACITVRPIGPRTRIS